MSDQVFWQYLLPQHILSRVVGWLADRRWAWLKNTFIEWFILHYQVDMASAQEPDPKKYETFNAFFTRALNKDARLIVDAPDALVCPIDGCISQMGEIKDETLIQAKNHDYDLTRLFANDQEATASFKDGHFITFYLAPKDYHRIHMPITGELRTMSYIPGKLFSVNTLSASRIPKLFARNERVVCIFDTSQGPMALVLVGAMIVGSIETVWAGVVTPGRPRRIHRWDYQGKKIILEKGQEMGRFKLGSSVILLMPAQTVEWAKFLRLNGPVIMGQLIGELALK